MKSILLLIFLSSINVFACDTIEAFNVAKESVNSLVKPYGAESFKMSGLVGEFDNLIGPFSFADSNGNERLGLISIKNCKLDGTILFGVSEYPVQ